MYSWGMDNTTVSKLQRRARLFDACVSELSPVAQEELNALVEYVAEFLSKGGGTDSAKELIIQVLRYKKEETK